jgi:hypothetical protein
MRRVVAQGLVLLILLGPGAPLLAQSLDPNSAAAVDAVMRMLQDPAQRGAAIAGNPQASAVDRQMQSMLRTPELQQEFYALAAAMFAELVQKSGGDVGRLTQAVEAAQRDPAGFVGTLSPATREQLRILSGKLGEQPR